MRSFRKVLSRLPFNPFPGGPTVQGLSRALALFFGLLFGVSFGFVHAGTIVQFRSAMGDVDVELYDQEKPVTVDNFLRYVVDGTYRDGFFHRAVNNFVIQGGGYGITNRGATNSRVVTFPVRAAITNEYGVGPFLSNVAGTIAMAKTSDPNSATSEFFFNLKDNKSLDDTNNSGGFTVFGRAVSGTDTLARWNSFTAGPPTNHNIIVNGGSVFNELPVYQLQTNSTGGFFISFSDLVYVDISLLQVRVDHRADGRAEIHWAPLAGRTNIVEFTTTFPPQWQVLSNVPPADLTAGVVVDPVADSDRFYRVRATY